jgi:hypothetical protein
MGRTEPWIGAFETEEGSYMKMRNAILSGVAGLMLTTGLGTVASAQPAYRYRNYSNMGRYAATPERQARQMVRQAYRDVLRREPDASGLRQYTDAMLNRGWSDTDVRRSLQQSDEYAQKFGYSRGYRGLYR